MNSRSSEIIINLSLAAFGIVIALIAAEIALELFRSKKSGAEFESLSDLRNSMSNPAVNTPYVLPDGRTSAKMGAVVQAHPDDRIIYEFRPNLDLIFTGAPVRTNEYGMRGPSVSKEKPKGTFRIALLGDSYAFGWGVDEDKSFCRVLERNLNEITKGNPRIELLNFAVPGYSTFQEVAAFEQKGAGFNPDAVLVFFIDNDFDLPFLIRDFSGSGELVESFSLFRFGSKMFHPNRSKEIVKERGLDPNRMLAELDDFTRDRNIRLFVAINPPGNWKGTKKRLPVLRQRRSIHFIKMKDEYEKIVRESGYSPKDLNLPDDPHPTELRHRIYGDLLTPAFASYIKEHYNPTH